MRVLRRIFQVIFGLLCLFVVATLVNDPSPDYVNAVPALIFFLVIIMVLGPWWPSPENIEQSKLDLPTDNPKIAFPLFAAGMGLSCFYLAWTAYSQPQHTFRRIERTIYMLFGAEGVVLFWLSVGVFLLLLGLRIYRQNKTV